MDLSERGWIEKYLTFLKKNIETGDYDSFLAEVNQTETIDHQLYKLLQPSGIMYGHPVSSPSINIPGMEKWDEKDKMKLILLDSLLQSSILINKSSISSSQDLVGHIIQSADDLNNFYENLYPNTKVKLKTIWGRKKTSKEITEEILTKRLGVKTTLSRNFWSSFFQNSLLFLDVFYFSEWLKENKGPTTLSNIVEQQENMRLTILKIIAAAAHANNVIEKEEEALYKLFINSAQLSKVNEAKAWAFLKEGVDIENIVLPENESWVLRKYVLELAILTIWSDKIVEDSERAFVKKLAKKLAFTAKELESSMLAIESFVISNWEHVHYLQKKHSLHIIKKRFSNRIAHVLTKNKKAIAQEIQESKELIQLLNKSFNQQLSAEEKEKVKQQIIDIIKTLPTFVIVALPGTVITLPVLLKILPKSVFPSAFNSDNII